MFSLVSKVWTQVVKTSNRTCWNNLGIVVRGKSFLMDTAEEGLHGGLIWGSGGGGEGWVNSKTLSSYNFQGSE